ncbi:MAG TPA: acetyl-CoA carboxylase biotin carboxylase subunit [Acidobacteriota bacterium]|nr:acetyl-CoA carboxylase biotin carboxylase subunit [Acidobacteriota bacterium]
MKMKRVLVANRGEIAVRVIRACRRIRLESVAVFSEADRAALPVRMADFACLIGPAAPGESYLNIDRIIAAAHRYKADAIHPGYGFLSENPVFAARVVDEGLTWIGPPAEAISLMGDKIAARRLITKQGVPIVPGSDGPITDPAAALAEAQKAGFPILLKAVAGGGGKGMRLVEKPEDWIASFEAAAREAERAFGDGRMYWEKYLQQPRHIEIQILGGPDGKAISLGERECSIQRRHQKVIEESPSTVVDPDMRARMSQAAVTAAQGCGYIGAGTVEFLVDRDRNFYFLEMNTRLQVEHPVTEAVTGCDLVIEQFRIAGGNGWTPPPLPPEPFGHAIEFRIYAEDPQNNFLPSPGTLSVYREPQGPGVRVDSGVYQGGEVPVHYDPLIAKLVVWGRDRTEAIGRAQAALEEFAVGGVATTIDVHRRVIAHPEFVNGNTTTDFLPRYLASTDGDAPIDADLRRALAVAATLYTRRQTERRSRTVGSGSASPERSDWLAAARREGVRRWSVLN